LGWYFFVAWNKTLLGVLVGQNVSILEAGEEGEGKGGLGKSWLSFCVDHMLFVSFFLFWFGGHRLSAGFFLE